MSAEPTGSGSRGKIEFQTIVFFWRCFCVIFKFGSGFSFTKTIIISNSDMFDIIKIFQYSNLMDWGYCVKYKWFKALFNSIRGLKMGKLWQTFIHIRYNGTR